MLCYQQPSSDYVYLPVAATAFGELHQHEPADLLREQPKVNRKGAAYLYYRSAARCERFVELLRKEGLTVHALGRCPRITTKTTSREDLVKGGTTTPITQYAPYKFVVAFENDDAPGYVTEKLGLAFLAGSVPIYWGPATDHIFSDESYVRCSDLEACAREVKRLDDDDGASMSACCNTQKLSKGRLSDPLKRRPWARPHRQDYSLNY